MKNLSNQDDFNEISQIIELYAEGWQNSIDKFSQAFEEDAWIFYINASGDTRKAKLADCFHGWAATNWIIETKALSFNQVGELTSVLINFNNKSESSASFVDNLTLLKSDGSWKITNKTAIPQNVQDKLIYFYPKKLNK